MNGSTATVIYLPCDVVPVRARLTVGENLSPIEKILLRVVAAGADTATEIAELLGLGERITLDVLHDLWRNGHLMIDFGTDKIAVSREIRERIAVGQLGTVAGLDSEEILRELMIDKLTGHVLPCRGPRVPPVQQFAVDHPRPDITLAGAPTDALVAALNQILEAEERFGDASGYDARGLGQEKSATRARTGRARRVRSTLTMPQDSRADSDRRWLPVEVQPAIDPNTNRLVVTVTDGDFPPERRDQASQLLTQLASDFPGDKFAVELRKIASPRLTGAPSLSQAIKRFAANAARTPTIPPGQRIKCHWELCADAQQLSRLVEESIANEVSADVVVDREHRRYVTQLIGQAQRQLIIVCPRIEAQTLRHFEKLLQSKIREGVQVVILWGMTYADELSTGAVKALDSLAREKSAAPILRPLISARTHAKVVIADDRAALVTSCNVLSPQSDRHEIGVLIKPVTGEHCQAVRNLLERVRAIVPDGRMSRQIAIQAQDFYPKSSDGEVPALALPGPPPDGVADDDPPMASAVRAWTAAWIAFAAQMSNRFEARTHVVATPVVDGEHRELLWYALRSVQRRLIITSDWLGADVCDKQFREAIRGCLARGVAVTIVYNRAADGSDSSGAVRELTALAAAHSDRMQLRTRGNHAKMLVWDDETITGSFNYLSYAGYPIRASYKQPSELSVRLTGTDIAVRLTAVTDEPDGVTLLSPLDTAAGQDQGQISPVAGEAVAQIAESARAGQRIRNEVLAGAAVGDVVRQRLAASDNPWEVLAALGPVADDVTRAAAARCILDYPTRVDPAALRTLIERLITDRWQEGAFTEAALLRLRLTDQAFRPRTWLALMAAVRGSAEADLALIAASEVELLAEERPALLAVSVTQLLLTGSDYAAYASLSNLAAQSQGTWLDLANIVLDYTNKAPGVLPREMLAAEVMLSRSERDRSAAWAALNEALLRCRPIPVPTAMGKKVHFALHRPTGAIGRLTESAAHRDRKILGHIYREVLHDGLSASDASAELVDQTWAKVAPKANLLEGKRRQRYLKRLEDVFKAAGDVLDNGWDNDAPAFRVHHDDEQRAAVIALTSELQRLWPDLKQAVSRVPLPERCLAEAALADLRVLLLAEEQ